MLVVVPQALACIIVLAAHQFGTRGNATDKEDREHQKDFPCSWTAWCQTRAARSPGSQEFENPKDIDWTYIYRGGNKSLQTAGKTYQTKHLNPLCGILIFLVQSAPRIQHVILQIRSLHVVSCYLYGLLLGPLAWSRLRQLHQAANTYEDQWHDGGKYGYPVSCCYAIYQALEVEGTWKRHIECFIVVNHQNSSCVAASS